MCGTPLISLNMLVRWFVAVLAIAYSFPLVASVSACQDPRLPFSDSQREGCRVHQVIFREGAASAPARLVQVIVGNRFFGDHGKPLYHYYLVNKNNDIEPMSE